ncbi:MAG TPA: transposase [Bacteroidales bacterium]|nr:transposase [Bacteroidales bacterium]
MAHSIEGKPLFVDDQDRWEFLSRFEKGLTKTGFLCYTWVLMNNHYHLFLRTSEKPMSKLMRGLNGGYASYYNKRHKKNGYLFQNRFKSVLCQDQNYAVQLIKYINLNPLRAGMVSSLEQLKTYPWCGHGFLLGECNAIGKMFQKREECLRRFGDNEQESIKAYLESLLQSCGDKNEIAGQLSNIEATEITGSCKGWPAVIGDPDFVKNVMEKYKCFLNRNHRKADYPYVLETISSKVCEEYGISVSELKKRGKNNFRANARAVFCYRLHMREFIPLSVIAGFLGTTISPIAVLVQKGAVISEAVSA